MGELNTAPSRINGVEGDPGQVKASGGPGAPDLWIFAGVKAIVDSYTGDGSTDRQIEVGFKCSLVIITSTDTGEGDEPHQWIAHGTQSIKHYGNTTTPHVIATSEVVVHASDGFTVNGYGNTSGKTYYYCTMSE